MTERGDFDLLGDYADHGSQSAFAELVRRYVDLVYSSAARQVRDVHAAEDVTQVVFIVLAKKARQIRPGPLLSSWLLGVTRFAAKDHLKRAERRGRHERAAAIERTAQMATAENAGGPGAGVAGSGEGPDAEVRRQLANVLDDALAKLSAPARDALVLRFFRNQSFKQVGERLGITELAARQRVFRALERLRGLLGRRGLSLGGESLAVALAAAAVVPAPGALGSAVAATATSAGAAAPYATLVKGTVSLMKSSSVKPVLVAAVVLVVVGVAVAIGAGAGWMKWPGRGGNAVAGANPLPAAPIPVGGVRPKLAAPLDVAPPENYAAPSFGWRTPGPRSGSAPAAESGLAPYDGPPITGTVNSPDGKPLAGVEALLTGVDGRRVVYSAMTRGDGRFEMRPRFRPQSLFLKSGEGHALLLADLIKPEMSITLTRWGRLELTVKEGAKAVHQARVTVYPAGAGQLSPLVGNMMLLANEEGRVIVEQVLPGETRVTWVSAEVKVPPENPAAWAERGTPRLPPREVRVKVEAGKTHQLTLGGVGRPVTGRIDLDVTEFVYRRGVIRRTSPQNKGADGSAADSAAIHFDAHADGTFTVMDVPPGEYEMAIELGATVGKNIKFVEPYAVARTTFKVPPIPGGVSEEPLDVGKVPVVPKKVVEVGEPFPKLAGKTAKGDPISMQDFNGQVVMVLVGDPAAGRSRGEFEWIHSVHGRFGNHGGFAMLTVMPGGPVGVASPAGGWPVMYVDALPEELGGSNARMFLVDGDGHVAAKNVTAAQVYAVLDRALEAKVDTRVTFDHVARAQARTSPPFEKIPGPSAEDAAHGARVSLVAGVPSWDTPKSDVNVLTDGRMPSKEDAPAEALFFQAGTLEGRFRIDLAEATDVAEIRTYSWHKDTRAAQLFRVYGSDGTDKNFDPAPDIGMDPTKLGWTNVALVDTRPEMKPVGVQGVARGGRYVSSISDKETLGTYKHLLFQVFVTEADDVFGHTFYGEIDVIPKK